MQRSDVIQRIQNGLGFRTDKQDEIILALQEAQRDLETGKTLPWFLIEEDQTLNFSANSPTIALPAGFLRLVEDEAIYTTDADSGRISYLERYEFDRAQDYFSSFTTPVTENRGYALRKSSFYLFPTPTVAGTLTYSYYKAADTLDADIENTWLANIPELLIGKAGVIMAVQLRDQDALAIFASMEEKWMNTLMDEIAAREMDNNPMALGENN